MTNFTNSEKASITQKLRLDLKANGVPDIPYSRPVIWAAAQAIRDELDDPTFRTTVSSAIDTAISPATMTNAEKKRLFGRVIQIMFPGEVA